MQIVLNSSKIIPFSLMVFFAIYASFDLTAVNLQMASYAILAATLIGGAFMLYKIIREKTIPKSDLVIYIFLTIIAISSFVHGTDAKNWIYLCISILLIRSAFYFYENHIQYLILGLASGFNIGLFLQLYQLITQPDIWIIPDTKEVAVYILGGNYNQIGIRILISLVINYLCIKIVYIYEKIFIIN